MKFLDASAWFCVEKLKTYSEGHHMRASGLLPHGPRAHLEQLDVEAQATLRGHLRRPAFGTIRVLPRHIYKTAGARAHALALALQAT